MKNWMIMTFAAVTLAGCADIPNYQSAVKTPPPANLAGNWQSMGPQKGLVSKEAIASLMITAEGDTLDCRQWQRVIAKPGKVTQLDGDWVNVTNQVRVMPLELEGTQLHYDKLVLQKVQQPTAECQQALDKQRAADAKAQEAATKPGSSSGDKSSATGISQFDAHAAESSSATENTGSGIPAIGSTSSSDNSGTDATGDNTFSR